MYWVTVECDLISVITLSLWVCIPSFMWLSLMIPCPCLLSLFGHKGPASLATVMDYLEMMLVEWILSFSSSLGLK